MSRVYNFSAGPSMLPEDVLKTAAAEMLSRIENRLYEEYEKDPHLSIRSILQRPYFVSNKIMIDDLFTGFRKHRTHIALVRDNHNKIVGMVTMEDILEEIVSDIAEPHSFKRRKA